MTDDKSHRESRGRKLVVGLAGGIAAGKSVVARSLAELGAKIIDSDALAHEELGDPEVIEAFRSWWGEGVCTPDGRIDKAAMGDIIFADAAERARMEEFLYPRLERRRQKLTAAFERDPAVRAIVIDSPLLYEFGLDRSCDVVILVDSRRESRLERAVRIRGWTEQEFERREKLQKPLDAKRKAADYRIVNNSSVDVLCSQVKPLFERLLADRLLIKSAPS